MNSRGRLGGAGRKILHVSVLSCRLEWRFCGILFRCAVF
ncbi:hypothetical protein APY03_2872 [Variovorax sp. WDL1]|nr:hypothetical protein APY03_2872 [Variovorax sp. WDL1]